MLPGADLAAAVKATLAGCMLNSGQTCSATTRLLVPRDLLAQAEELVQGLLPGYRMGDPADGNTRLGPLVSQAQQHKVRDFIDQAIAGGARRVGASGELPPHGFFVPATVLSDVTPGMAIAQEEVFGPVLCLMAYDSEAEGIAIANGTAYGLAGAVWGPVASNTLAVASRMRAGQVDVNGAPFNPQAPFGGFRQSGIERLLAAGGSKPPACIRIGRCSVAITELQLHFKNLLVPETGVEPVRVSPHAPQACVSSIFTTPAIVLLLNIFR